MSLINGIDAFGSGLSALAANGVKDALATNIRAPLLSSGSASPAEATPASAPPAVPAAVASAAVSTPVPAPAQATAVPAATGGGTISVPSALLPIYQAASKRTGIPLDVLVAQAKQESNFDANAVGRNGEIGLHQIKPSTAVNPGYGLQGIDPATLKDPVVNINFAADYLKARAGQGINFNDPAAVDAALRAYNAGGDPNYVANVRRYIGAS